MVLENSYKLEKFDPEVLREYDIRGIVDKNITENTAYTIGRLFGHVVYEKLKSKYILPIKIRLLSISISYLTNFSC